MQKITVSLLFAALMVASAGALFAQAEPNQVPPGQALTVLVPASSREAPEDVGKRAHTNHVIALRSGQSLAVPSGNSPANIRDAYALPSTGGGGVIAIVDAYHYPTAENDLNVFSGQFSLPPCTTANGCFQLVSASGSQPAVNCGWAQEAALDIEWAHAMAPNAKIVLVEAASNSFSDLLQAVDVATSNVTGSNHNGQVSMSWGGSEFSSETGYDIHFPQIFGASGAIYFAASGDSGGKTIYPSASPNVVSAGGTTLVKNGGTWTETGWSGSGGGPSKFESRPSYQDNISIIGRTRGTPDFSFDADPNTGVSVYDSTSCGGLVGWMVFGGTSVSSPSLAGIVNLAGSGSSNTMDELSLIYSNRTNTADFRDITSGRAGKYSAKTGWDFVTGVGSDQSTSGK
jgi:subtilase family serine protease